MMTNLIPVGAVALDEAELDEMVGGTLWRILAGAAAFGYTVGRWLACAVECVAFN